MKFIRIAEAHWINLDHVTSVQMTIKPDGPLYEVYSVDRTTICVETRNNPWCAQLANHLPGATTGRDPGPKEE